MGHYWGEMEDRAPDPYNYKAVNDAGFESVSTSGYGTSIKRCPHCFALIKGEDALAHLTVAHAGRDTD